MIVEFIKWYYGIGPTVGLTTFFVSLPVVFGVLTYIWGKPCDGEDWLLTTFLVFAISAGAIIAAPFIGPLLLLVLIICKTVDFAEEARIRKEKKEKAAAAAKKEVDKLFPGV